MSSLGKYSIFQTIDQNTFQAKKSIVLKSSHKIFSYQESFSKMTFYLLISLAGNFQNRNLGPNPWDQINLIYNVPEEDSTAAEANILLEPILETSHHQEVPTYSDYQQWAQDS